MKKSQLLLLILFFIIPLAYAAKPIDPLPSWNEGPAKKAILDFVRITTDIHNSKYVPPHKRIATFDQDGTLMIEQPLYTQLIFTFDRIAELAPKHPEWQIKEPFKSILAKNKNLIAHLSSYDLDKLLIVTHAGMSVEDFAMHVKKWFAKARNQRWNRPYTDLVYQPMLEVIQYLRKNNYKTYIVTGSGQEFVRTYCERVYGVTPADIIGSEVKTHYTYNQSGKGVLLRDQELLLDNNAGGKAEDIHLFIGQHPTIAFGNSIGDQQMFEYAEANEQAHLIMLVQHDDAKREYAYGVNSNIGNVSAAFIQKARKHGWISISMKNDWKQIFPKN